MNPIGLFVSQSFEIVKRRFDYGGVIMEFSTKLSNLDYPVWNGQNSYFGVGSDPMPFKNWYDRNMARADYESEANRSTMDAVRNSDNPALANSLLDKSEKQALFVGNLNPNQIKRFWVKRKSGNGNTWEPLSRKEFLKEFGNTEYSHEETNRMGVRGKWCCPYGPNDKWGGYDDFVERLSKHMLRKEAENLANTIKKIVDTSFENDEIDQYGDNWGNAYQTLRNNWHFFQSCLYPKQIMALIGPEAYYKIASNGIYDRGIEEPEEDIY